MNNEPEAQERDATEKEQDALRHSVNLMFHNQGKRQGIFNMGNSVHKKVSALTVNNEGEEELRAEILAIIAMEVREMLTKLENGDDKEGGKQDLHSDSERQDGTGGGSCGDSCTCHKEDSDDTSGLPEASV